MIRFEQLKQIHIEITNNCQAACPMCSRNNHGGMVNPLIKLSEWSLESFKHVITLEVLHQIDMIYFCGNFGDPILNSDLPEMCKYIKDNSDVAVRIHTNGSLRNTEWWSNLVSCLPERHTVIFGIDGMEDTHSRYRIGTSWDKVIRNAKSFISAGGNADWAYIAFEHNQHQVEEARSLAKLLGFQSFYKKDSSRFIDGSSYPVYNQRGETVDHLKPSSTTTIKFVDRSVLTKYKEIVANTTIDCYVQHTKEIYLDSQMKLMPCCFIAGTPYNYTEESSVMYDLRQTALEQYHSILKDLGGSTCTLTRSIKDIVNSEEYQTVWHKYWNSDDKPLVCVKTCGKNNISKPKDQFVERSKLNE